MHPSPPLNVLRSPRCPLLLLFHSSPSISPETPSRAQLRRAGQVVCAGGGGGLGQMVHLEQLVRDACGQTMDSFCPSENK